LAVIEVGCRKKWNLASKAVISLKWGKIAPSFNIQDRVPYMLSLGTKINDLG